MNEKDARPLQVLADRGSLRYMARYVIIWIEYKHAPRAVVFLGKGRSRVFDSHWPSRWIQARKYVSVERSYRACFLGV